MVMEISSREILMGIFAIAAVVIISLILHYFKRLRLKRWAIVLPLSFLVFYFLFCPLFFGSLLFQNVGILSAFGLPISLIFQLLLRLDWYSNLIFVLPKLFQIVLLIISCILQYSFAGWAIDCAVKNTRIPDIGKTALILSIVALVLQVISIILILGNINGGIDPVDSALVSLIFDVSLTLPAPAFLLGCIAFFIKTSSKKHAALAMVISTFSVFSLFLILIIYKNRESIMEEAKRSVAKIIFEIVLVIILMGALFYSVLRIFCYDFLGRILWEPLFSRLPDNITLVFIFVLGFDLLWVLAVLQIPKRLRLKIYSTLFVGTITTAFLTFWVMMNALRGAMH
jgi:hypothetical protein